MCFLTVGCGAVATWLVSTLAPAAPDREAPRPAPAPRRGGATNAQQPPRAPPPSPQLPKLPAAEVVAVPDLHGDWDLALRSLRLAGIVSGTGAWAAQKTHLVQTGNLAPMYSLIGADNGKGSLMRLASYFRRLRDDAHRNGGEISLLLGSGELANLERSRELVNVLEAETEDSKDASDLKQWVPGGPADVVMRRERSVSVVVGEGACRSAFVHAGLNEVQMAKGRLAAAPSEDAAERILSGLDSSLRVALGEIAAVSDHRWQWLFGDSGPFRDKTLSTAPERDVCPAVERVLAELGAERVVVGHARQPTMRTRCAGRLHLIDVGISQVYTGKPAAWECRDGVTAQIMEDGSRHVLDPRGSVAPTAALPSYFGAKKRRKFTTTRPPDPDQDWGERDG